MLVSQEDKIYKEYLQVHTDMKVIEKLYCTTINFDYCSYYEFV